MSTKLTLFFTVASLLALVLAFPILLDHWVITIAKTIPSFFTLGISTVLLYKAFRYPKGTIFTFVGLALLALTGWIVFKVIDVGIAWASVPILIAAIVFGPRFTKALWKWLDVDSYYKKSSGIRK